MRNKKNSEYNNENLLFELIVPQKRAFDRLEDSSFLIGKRKYLVADIKLPQSIFFLFIL